MTEGEWVDVGGRWDWVPHEQPPSPDGGLGLWHVLTEVGTPPRWEWHPAPTPPGPKSSWRTNVAKAWDAHQEQARRNRQEREDDRAAATAAAAADEERKIRKWRAAHAGYLWTSTPTKLSGRTYSVLFPDRVEARYLIDSEVLHVVPLRSVISVGAGLLEEVVIVQTAAGNQPFRCGDKVERDQLLARLAAAISSGPPSAESLV